MKLRTGDKVIVLAGKDKGTEGEISAVIPEKNKVIIEGVNTARKHQKPTSAMQEGGIIDKDMPIHASNVAIVSPKDGKPTRIGYRFDGDGNKVRICRRTGEDI